MAYRQVRDRALRLELLHGLRKEHPDWTEEKIIAVVALKTGVRPTRVREYIDLMKTAGEWI